MLFFITDSEKQTETFGFEVGKILLAHYAPGLVCALYGGLGAGKTAFIRGAVKGLRSLSPCSSPTFGIVNEYEGAFPILHFDMYRISSFDDLFSTGYFEMLEQGLLLIEWSENIEEYLPGTLLRIKIETNGTNRSFAISAPTSMEEKISKITL